MTSDRPKNKVQHRTFQEIFFTKWRWWLAGSILSFILASVLMTGWPSGIKPNLSYPYVYTGDGLGHSWLAQRAIEGWVFDNPRSGYPFGASFFDYPGSDAGNLLLLKIIGLVTGQYYSAINIFILLSFAATFIVSYCSFGAFGLSSALSFSASLLFTFLPFHFLRINHLFYLWYFSVPLLFYICYVATNSGKFFSNDLLRFKKSTILLLVAFVFSSFGVYYALFGVIIMVFCAMAGLLKTGNVRSAQTPAIVALMIFAGVALNLAPNLINKTINGANPEVAVRAPAEAEIYGLKLMQLILPRPDHRVPQLAAVTRNYAESYPLVNENKTSSLGAVGAAGLVVSFFILVGAFAGRKIDTRLTFLSMLVLVLFLFGTVGGLGALFSATITSSIRGWNRISVFIAFGSIAIFFIALELCAIRFISAKNVKKSLLGSSIVLSGLGLYDQTVPACLSCNEQTKTAFDNDRNFVGEIEKSLPKGSAVYQLPYMPFPEVAPLNRLGTYDLVAGFLHSKDLRWNYAGMKGREGDLFYRSLAKEPVEKQLEVISRLGFAGIYVDRRGFQDNADRLIASLSLLLGQEPLLKRADGQVVFFPLPISQNINFSGLSNSEIMMHAGYIVDNLGPRYIASFREGIDFTRRTWPDFIKGVQGVSGPESWGRWSDANLAQSVHFDFSKPLPSKFTLVLQAQPYGRNGEQKILVKVGEQTLALNIKSNEREYRIPISLGNEQTNWVEFIPQDPISPKELGVSGDTRKLGIGLIHLRFEK